MCVGSCQEHWIMSSRSWQAGAAQRVLSNGMLCMALAHLGRVQSLIRSSILTMQPRAVKYVLSYIWLKPFKEFWWQGEARNEIPRGSPVLGLFGHPSPCCLAKTYCTPWTFFKLIQKTKTVVMSWSQGEAPKQYRELRMRVPIWVTTSCVFVI